MLRSGRFLLHLTLVLFPLLTQAATDPSWTKPFPPFRIAGNLYYVGSEELASYLVVTPEGDILINSNLPGSAGQIRRSVEMLGFQMRDIKVLLISHAHYDHAGGSAALLKITPAKYEVMDADVPIVESGGARDFALGSDARFRFPPAKVDRVLHDGDTVSLGGTTLTAHKTAGHTRGCTTWSMPVETNGTTANAVIVCSTSVLDSYRLVGNESYPGIAEDYRRTFQRLKALPCDIFLASHASFFDLGSKYVRIRQAGPNPFLDSAGYRKFVKESESDFQSDLQKQTESRR